MDYKTTIYDAQTGDSGKTTYAKNIYSQLRFAHVHFKHTFASGEQGKVFIVRLRAGVRVQTFLSYYYGKSGTLASMSLGTPQNATRFHAAVTGVDFSGDNIQVIAPQANSIPKAPQDPLGEDETDVVLYFTATDAGDYEGTLVLAYIEGEVE